MDIYVDIPLDGINNSQNNKHNILNHSHNISPLLFDSSGSSNNKKDLPSKTPSSSLLSSTPIPTLTPTPTTLSLTSKSPYIKSSQIIKNNNNNNSPHLNGANFILNETITSPTSSSNINNSNNSNNNSKDDNLNNQALNLIKDIDDMLYNNNKDESSKISNHNSNNNKSNNKVYSFIKSISFKPFLLFKSFRKQKEEEEEEHDNDIGSAPLISNNSNNNETTIDIEFDDTTTTTTTTNITKTTSTKNIILYTSYVILLYLIYGILQELLFKNQKVNFFALYSFSQFFFSFLFSIRDIIIQQNKQNQSSQNSNQSNQLNNNFNQITHLQIFQKLSIKKIKLYTFLSIILFLTKTLGNESLRLLSYKTKILFQTSKIIPVMIIGGFLFKRSHTISEYTSIGAMLLGLFLFTLGDSVSSILSILGIILIISYIFVESIKSLLYEKILKDFSSELELSLFTNFFGSILTLPILFYSGEFKNSIYYLLTNKLVFISMLGFISLGYFANIAYLNLLKITDSLYANVISSIRKFLTILLSFLLFKDTILTSYHIIGIIIFFIGSITSNIKSKDLKVK